MLLGVGCAALRRDPGGPLRDRVLAGRRNGAGLVPERVLVRPLERAEGRRADLDVVVVERPDQRPPGLLVLEVAVGRQLERAGQAVDGQQTLAGAGTLGAVA